MTIAQLIEHMKQKGLGKYQRSLVVETYREEGETAALKHVEVLLMAEAKAIADARVSAKQLCGVSI
jgi:hypothetical protein